MYERGVVIKYDSLMLRGDLSGPDRSEGLVVFAHGSGSGRHSPRNRAVSRALVDAGLATLLMDLLTEDEERVDERTRVLRFDIDMLADRVVAATRWVSELPEHAGERIGLFGASTGAAAALKAAARQPDLIHAVVSRGGRPDLAGDDLPLVRCPVLLIVGGHDEPVIEMNQEALERLECQKELVIVPRATHLFEEPGALERVSALASEWFVQHLSGAAATGRTPRR